MKILTSILLAGAVALATGMARADDKVGKGAEESGKTVVHGTTSVGKGASKVYHDVAKGVHKVIAHNAKNPHTKAAHMRKANIHEQHATEKAHQSKKEMNKASNSADKVGK